MIKHRRTHRLLLLSAAAAAGILATLPGVASADSTSATAARIQHDVAGAVAFQGDDPASPITPQAGWFSASGDGGSADIPRDPSDPATFASGDVSVAIGLPTNDAAATKVGSTVVYGGQADSGAVAVQAIPDGLRALLTIDEASAPHDYPFPLSGDVASIVENPDGTLALYDASGEDIGSVDAPWATDANGAPVATHFVINGTTVTQVVGFTSDTVFPVVADPAIHLHWTTFTVELYPKDQRALAAGVTAVGVPAIVAAICSPLPVSEPFCAGVGRGLAATLASYVALYFHPHCHLNLSFYYGPVLHLDRWWTSQCI